MLPKTEIPTITRKLPVSGKKVQVRALTTKEEKNLLIAKSAGDDNHINEALLNLIVECTYKKIKPDDLCSTDMSAIFLWIMELSKGTIIEHQYVCQNIVNDKPCGTNIKVPVDITKVKFEVPEGEHKDGTISVSNNVKVKLTFPTTNIYNEAKKNSTNDVDIQLRICAYCIEYVATADEIFNDFTKDEIYEWLLGLSSSDVAKIVEYISHTPTALLEYDIVCPVCGAKSKMRLNSISDFFMNDTPVNQ